MRSIPWQVLINIMIYHVWNTTVIAMKISCKREMKHNNGSADLSSYSVFYLSKYWNKWTETETVCCSAAALPLPWNTIVHHSTFVSQSCLTIMWEDFCHYTVISTLRIRAGFCRFTERCDCTCARLSCSRESCACSCACVTEYNSAESENTTCDALGFSRHVSLKPWYYTISYRL